MADVFLTEDLDKLVLAWLAARSTREGRKAPAQESLVSAVRPHLRGSGLSPESAVRQSLARLRAGGDIESDTTLVLSPAGLHKALALLGLPGLPKRASWRWVLSVLVAKGLGMEPTPTSLRRATRPEELAAATLQSVRGIKSGSAASLTQVGNALAWRELGVESTTPFTLKAVLTNVLRRTNTKVSLPKKHGPKDVVRAIASAELGVSRGHAPLQVALVQRWLRQSNGAPAPRPSPSGPAEVASGLESFAARALSAARASKTGHYGEYKVFVSHVWAQLQRAGGAAGLDLATFKQELVRANQAGLLRLSRADLVEAMSPEDVASSRIESMGATFHFVRTDGP